MAYTRNDYGAYKTNTSGKVLSYAKVFGFMLLLLAISAGICCGTGALLENLIVDEIERANAMLIITFSSAILSIVMSFVMQFAFLKKGKSAFGATLLYAISNGLLLSSFSIYLPWQVLGGAFGITALIFGLMAFCAFLCRKINLNIIALIASFLLGGAGLMILFSWIFCLFIPGLAFEVCAIYMVVSFAAMMLITLFDIWRINQIVELGADNNNLSLYCAVTLYIDFIQIFIRVLWFIIMSSRH